MTIISKKGEAKWNSAAFVECCKTICAIKEKFWVFRMYVKICNIDGMGTIGLDFIAIIY